MGVIPQIWDRFRLYEKLNDIKGINPNCRSNVHIASVSISGAYNARGAVMTQFILDMFFTLVFVLLFIFLVRIKERAFVENRESYRYTVSGISVLFFASLLRLLNHQGLFDTVPFLSENIYFDLSEAIGIVTGIALMIAGVSIWLPMKRRAKDDDNGRAKQSLLIQEIFLEIIQANEINNLFERIPKSICKGFGFSGSAVYRLNHKRGRFICSNLNDPKNSSKKLEKLQFEPGTALSVLEDVDNVFGTTFPLLIEIDGRLKAVILFWREEDEEVSADDRMALEKIERTLSYRLKSQFLRHKQIYTEESLQYLRQMQSIISMRKDVRRNIQNFHLLFNRASGAEYFSLAVLDKHRKNLRRYTVGMDRRILLENGACLPIENTQIEAVLANRRGLLIADIGSDSKNNVDSLFASCGQRCLLAVPIINYDRIIAVITLGHPKARFFGRRHQHRAEMLASIMAAAVESEIARQTIYERDRFLGAIAAFDSIVQNSSDMESVLKAATDLLIENIGTTMVRISVLNKTRTDLFTRSLKSVRAFEDIRVDKAGISKEMTPWHQMAIEENRPLLINQKDPETFMNINEAGALVFEKMQSALIVPIVVNGITYGLITLGEMRNWDRFSYKPATITFCKEIATRIGDAVKIFSLSRAIMKGREDDRAGKFERPIDADIRRELKSPLTNMRGSLDLLKLKGLSDTHEAGRIINTLEESTNRMISLLTDETEKVLVRE